MAKHRIEVTDGDDGEDRNAFGLKVPDAPTDHDRLLEFTFYSLGAVLLAGALFVLWMGTR